MMEVINHISRKKFPLAVYSYENIPFDEFPVKFNSLGSALRSTLNNFIIRPTAVILGKQGIAGVVGANTEALNNIDCMGQKRLVYWPIDFRKFKPSDKKEARKNIGISETDKIVGYVGRIVEEKGLVDLVHAISEMPGYKLALVGSGNYSNELQKLCEQLGISDRVKFFGQIHKEDLIDYYNAFDVFVLPSKTTKFWKEAVS